MNKGAVNIKFNFLNVEYDIDVKPTNIEFLGLFGDILECVRDIEILENSNEDAKTKTIEIIKNITKFKKLSHIAIRTLFKDKADNILNKVIQDDFNVLSAFILDLVQEITRNTKFEETAVNIQNV